MPSKLIGAACGCGCGERIVSRPYRAMRRACYMRAWRRGEFSGPRCERCPTPLSGREKRWCRNCRTSVRKDQMRAVANADPQGRRYAQISSRYGLDRTSVDLIWRQQNGSCAVCNAALVFHSASPADTFHVDHDHGSGRVRGFLCADCNVGLGRFGDSPERLLLAAAYLERNRGD